MINTWIYYFYTVVNCHIRSWQSALQLAKLPCELAKAYAFYFYQEQILQDSIRWRTSNINIKHFLAVDNTKHSQFPFKLSTFIKFYKKLIRYFHWIQKKHFYAMITLPLGKYHLFFFKLTFTSTFWVTE